MGKGLIFWVLMLLWAVFGILSFTKCRDAPSQC